MKLLAGLIVVLVGAMPNITSAKEAYICLEKVSVGLHYENGRFNKSGFNEQRFTMVKDQNIIQVKYGETEEKFVCEYPSVTSPFRLQCKEIFYFMTLNMNSLEFWRTQIFPSDPKEGRDTASVSYGTCQKF